MTQTSQGLFKTHKKLGIALGGGILLLFLAAALIGSNNRVSDSTPITPTLPVSTATPLPTQSKTPKPQALGAQQVEGSFYSVIKVVDGDTIAVDINGKSETLRLIGIDTPETVDPRKPVQCFGKEASAKAKELLDGQRVRLEADSSQGERDKYDRLLRYVFLEDGTNFNLMMIEEGYAFEYTYDTPYKYQDEFRQAERQAREEKRGLWADDTCAGEVQGAFEASTPATSPQTSDCDCSGNVYNCTDFKTHDEAQACFESCGGASNDIHRLDRDKDGNACESLPQS